jgi:DNA-binding transcriptional LysR family regulator
MLLQKWTSCSVLSEYAAGRTYYKNARRIIEDAKATEERLHIAGDQPFGELRMSVPVVFAHGCLNRWLPEFLEHYPEVTLNIDVSERRTDLIAEGIDLLVRIGNLPSSDLIARELFKSRRLTVASPDYLARHGTPSHPSELKDHVLIDFSFHGGTQSWTFPSVDQGEIAVPISPRIRCNDAQSEKSLALAGQGITRLPSLACERELDTGALVPILTEFEPDPVGVHVVYASKDNLPAKTRAMIDFLIEKTN